MEMMISVERAINLIQQAAMPLSPEMVDIKNANGLILAQDICSPIDIPGFKQSNMDGYAFAFNEGTTEYKLVGEVAAGNSNEVFIEKGMAVRIFTGAAVPAGADTVLMQEKAKILEDSLMLLDGTIKAGDNVRPIGAEMKKGTVALAKGSILKPSSIGLIASLGINEVMAFPMPKIGILVTGNELQQPGLPISYGQVYESNSFTLMSALTEWQLKSIKVVQVIDHLETLSNHLMKLLNEVDMVLITGGVSVGDYDYTAKAFDNCGVESIFHKVKQKPGKPLLFGKKGNKIVVGLPGNPASVLTCFYLYVLPLIGLLARKEVNMTQLNVPITHDYQKPEGLTHFLKAFYNGENVCIQSGQESYKLSSYTTANCLVVLPEKLSHLTAGTMVAIYLLP